MSKEQKNNFVPKLRFPEFKNKEEWEEKTLASVCTNSYSGGTPPTTEVGYYSGNIPFIRSAEIGKESTELFLSEEGLKNSSAKLISKGDVLVALYGANSGDVALAKIDGAINQAVLCLKAGQSNGFIYQFLSFKKNWIVSKYIQGGQGNLSGEIIKSIKLFFPNPCEQQKIAACLSSLDDLINGCILKLDNLRAHKKGLMQELFPREGQKEPRLRFEEFKNSGGWEEKLLGEIGEVLMCKRIFAEQTNEKEGVPFYKIGTLGSKPDAFISKDLFKEYKSKYKYPRKGEILITCSGTVGKCIIFDGLDAYYQDSNIVWIDNPNLEISNELLYYLISNVDWSRLNSTTITRIYGADLRNLKITYPKHKLEQSKIVACLSSIDKQIIVQEEKIEMLRQHKNGLMQVLFPNY